MPGVQKQDIKVIRNAPPVFDRRVAVAKCSRNAKYSFELSITEGEILEIINQKMEDSLKLEIMNMGSLPLYWEHCKNSNGLIGLVGKAVIQEMENISARKYFLTKATKELLKNLLDKKEDLKSLGAEIHHLIGNEGVLLAHFGKELVATFQNAEGTREKAMALHVMEHYTKGNAVLKNLVTSKIEDFSEFVKSLHCETDCPEAIVDYVTKVMDDWLTQFDNCKSKEEINAFVKHYKTQKEALILLKASIDKAVLEDWAVVPENRKSTLEKFVKLMRTPTMISKIVDYFCEKLQECQKEVVRAHRNTLYRNAFFLCKAVVKESEGFAKEMRQRPEYLKAVVAHKPKIEVPTPRTSTDDQMDTSPSTSGQIDNINPVTLSTVRAEEVHHRNAFEYDPDQVFDSRFSLQMMAVLHDMIGTINHYSVDDIETFIEIGAGAQAQALQARIKNNPEMMVLKKYNNQFVSSFAEMIKELAKLLECGRHPYIVQVYGAVYAEKQLVTPVGILMEYMELGCLHDTIHNTMEKYYEKEVLEWSIQVAMALQHLHSKGLIHRDVKPANILLTYDDTGYKVAKLADFGMAKRDNPQAGNAPRSLFGTDFYIAPEGRFGVAGSYSMPVDIYSLGISIWEIAQRKAPFDPRNLVCRSDGIYRPDLSDARFPWLANLVERMWDENPKLRPKIDEVIAELKHHYTQLIQQ